MNKTNVNMDGLTILVVNFNSTILLNRLLNSLPEVEKIIKDIVIVDNCSSDIKNLKIPTILKNLVVTIHNKQNYGFAQAVNMGIKKSRSNYILLLNPDSYIPKHNGITQMLKYLSLRKDIGIIGGTILSPDFKITPSANIFRPTIASSLFVFTNFQKIFPNNKYARSFYFQKYTSTRFPIEVDSVCGAFLLFRKYMGEEMSVMDDKYFLYLEDVDFCLKNKERGYKVVFYPKASIIHTGGGSNRSKYNILLEHWYKSRRILYKKYTHPILFALIILIFSTEETLLHYYHLLKNEPSK